MFGSFTPATATPYVEGSPSSGYMSPYYNTASGSAASPGIYQSMSPSYVSMSPSRSMAGGDGLGFRMGSPQFNPRRYVGAMSLIVIVVDLHCHVSPQHLFPYLSTYIISPLSLFYLIQYCVQPYLTGVLSDFSGLQSYQVMHGFCIMDRDYMRYSI